jgi:hypothetical protein
MNRSKDYGLGVAEESDRSHRRIKNGSIYRLMLINPLITTHLTVRRIASDLVRLEPL